MANASVLKADTRKSLWVQLPSWTMAIVPIRRKEMTKKSEKKVPTCTVDGFPCDDIECAANSVYNDINKESLRDEAFPSDKTFPTEEDLQ